MKKIFRRLLSVLLSVFLLTGMFAGSAFAEQEKEPAFALDSIQYGFRTYRIGRVDYMDTDLYFMEHEKSGAQLIYAACDDQERTFGVAFRTEALNDEGLPHVFEHTVLSGSDKYPDSNLVFSMMNQTYNAYINAETRQFSTLYPIASYSEEQLFADMDLYMDGVLHPAILKDERVMMREAWHYNLDDPDDEITVSGVVYSEVSANTGNIQYAATRELKKLLFPGSYSANDPGGIASVIPEMTWQELLDFHARYYHPSNMLILLYGDFSDIGRFLGYLDSEYLSRYDRTEISHDDPDYVPAEGYQEARYAFPSAQNAETDQAACIDYAFVLEDMTREDLTLARVSASSMSSATSPVAQRMAELFPLSSFSVRIDESAARPLLHFTLMSAREEDAPAFRAAVDELMPVIMSGSADENTVRQIINTEQYNRVTVRETSNAGVSFFGNLVNAWSATGRADAWLEELRYSDDLERYLEEGSIATVLGKYLSDAPASAMIVAVPEPGLAEKNAAEQAAGLAEMKAAMTAEEIQALVDQCADYNAWLESNARISLIDRMKVVDAASLPEEADSIAVTDETVDSVRYITGEVPDSETYDVKIWLDAQSVPLEELLEVSLAFTIMGRCGTDQYSRTELQSEMDNKVTSISYTPVTLSLADGTSHQYVCLQSNGLTGQLEDSFRLMEEVALHTDFNDCGVIREVISEAVMAVQLMSAMMPEAFMGGISKAAADPQAFVDYYIGFSPENWQWMLNISMMSDEDLAGLADRMREGLRYVLNRPGAIVTASGSAETIRRCLDGADALLGKLGNEAYEPVDYAALSNLKGGIALVSDTPVAYDYLVYNKGAGAELNGRDLVASAVVTDMILLPELRFRNNAYSAGCSVTDSRVTLNSYRDPNVAETYEVFASIPEKLRALELTQEQLDGYITAAYSETVKHPGPMARAQEAIECAMTGRDPSQQLRLIREIKSVTVEDIRAAADLFERVSEEGVPSACVNEEMLAENPGLFETVLRYSMY